MDSFEIYTLCLCLIVLIVLTTLFTVMLSLIVKNTVRLICYGAEDERILKAYSLAKKREKKQRGGWLGTLLFALVFGVFFLIFVFSIFAKATEKNPLDKLPSMRVVKTSSMQEKYEGNTYLFENHLDDQISTFDLIITYKLPDEFDLKLYDIVVYETENTLIVHRIVGIEEPNDKHPNERYFLLQGDNLESPDRFPVHYSQMKAIYRGEHIPFLGSFVLFMQSPSGWICVLLVILEMICMPIVEKRIENEEKKRLQILLSQKSTLSEVTGNETPSENSYHFYVDNGQSCAQNCNVCYYYYCCHHCGRKKTDKK